MVRTHRPQPVADVGNLAMDIAIGQVGELAFHALLVDEGVGDLEAHAQPASPCRIHEYARPVRVSQPGEVGGPRLDAPVALRVKVPVRARIFGHPEGAHRVVWVGGRGIRPALRMHQPDQINGVHRGHGLHIVEYALHAFVVQVPGVQRSVHFKLLPWNGCRNGRCLPPGRTLRQRDTARTTHCGRSSCLHKFTSIHVTLLIANTWLTAALLILRRRLHVIDDDNGHGPFGGFELQPQLLLDRGEDRRVIVRWRR